MTRLVFPFVQDLDRPGPAGATPASTPIPVVQLDTRNNRDFGDLIGRGAA